MEQLTEGWVRFSRQHFEEGFIDRWMGDCLHNPNLPCRPLLSLNSVTSYYRLNGTGAWVDEGSFSRQFRNYFLFHLDLSAQLIWDEFLLPEEPYLD